MSTRVTAHINLDALKHNFQRVKDYAPNAKVMAAIKGNAYGHGMLEVATGLPEVDMLAVERPAQAYQLRDHGIEQPIIVLGGFDDELELQEMAAQGIMSVVHTTAQVSLLENTDLIQPIAIWAKLNTGMNRLGFSEQAFSVAYQRLTKLNNIQQPFGLMTHFARADEIDNPATANQVKCFDQMADKELPQSLSNSAAIISRPETHRDYVRPGIMLYGISPFSDQVAEAFDLKPVMTLSSRLIDINVCKKGDAVGYGGTWVCPEDMPVGVVAVGYGDGYPRHAKNGTPVLVNDTICPLVGRVSMDLITVDLRPTPMAKIGDPVVLWGEGLPVETVALHSETIAYELVTKVTERVRRTT